MGWVTNRSAPDSRRYKPQQSATWFRRLGRYSVYKRINPTTTTCSRLLKCPRHWYNGDSSQQSPRSQRQGRNLGHRAWLQCCSHISPWLPVLPISIDFHRFPSISIDSQGFPSSKYSLVFPSSIQFFQGRPAFHGPPPRREGPEGPGPTSRNAPGPTCPPWRRAIAVPSPCGAVARTGISPWCVKGL